MTHTGASPAPPTPAGAKTTTSYKPAAPTRATTLKITNAKNWTTATTLHPLRGVPVRTVDQNNRTTELAYDALGPTTAVWFPGRARTDSASKKLTYELTNTGTSSVTTEVLRSDESYATSIAILDALGRQVQVQSVPQNGATGSRVITDSFYDSHGRVAKTNDSCFNTTSDPVKTRFIADDNTVPAQTGTFYDGLGRPVAKTFSSKAKEQWRTTTAYPAVERIDTTPPSGDTATTTTITDVLGRKGEQRRYKTGKPEENSTPPATPTTAMAN
jgi:YD repeat-containing protein